MKQAKYVVMSLALLILMAVNVMAQETAEEIMKKSHMAYYYAGDDGVADVSMKIIDKKGNVRDREFVMLRLDLEDGGNQKYYTYFKKPSDVSRLTFMVYKNADANDQRWIYVPAVDLVKQISADDKNSSFVGSDFSYEDVSGRHWSVDNHSLVKDSVWNDKPVWVIESIPKAEKDSFARRLSYIDKTTYLPYKELYYGKKDILEKEMTAEEIKEVDGIMTITHRTMKDVKKDRITHVIFDNIDYNAGIKDDLFTERYLMNPPMEFIK